MYWSNKPGKEEMPPVGSPGEARDVNGEVPEGMFIVLGLCVPLVLGAVSFGSRG